MTTTLNEDEWVSILLAMAMSILGYLRSTPPESFELDKFLATIIISLIMGALTLGFGWDYTTAEEWLPNGAITLYSMRARQLHTLSNYINIKCAHIMLHLLISFVVIVDGRNFKGIIV